jgi:5'-nucleotidase
MLNVNVPNQPVDRIKGIEITRLGDRSYMDMIDRGHDGKRDYYWIVRGVPQWDVHPGTDIWALEQNKISMTLYPDSSDTKLSDLLNTMAPSLFDELMTTVVHK